MDIIHNFAGNTEILIFITEPYSQNMHLETDV